MMDLMQAARRASDGSTLHSAAQRATSLPENPSATRPIWRSRDLSAAVRLYSSVSQSAGERFTLR